MSKLKQILHLLPLLGLMVACGNDASIQTYYVDKSNSADFISLDLPTSLFTANADLTSEEKKTLSNLKKLKTLSYINL